MSSDDTFSMQATHPSAPIATEMPCGHIFWGNPPEVCSVCAKIKAAREEVLEMARAASQMPKRNAGVMYEIAKADVLMAIDQAYNERYEQG